MGLGTVLHQVKSVLFAQACNTPHMAGHAVQMDHQNGFGPLCDLFLDPVNVDAKVRIGFHEDGNSTVDGDAHHAGDVCVGLYDDLVAWAYAQHPEGKPEGVQSACKSDAVRRACIGGKFLFKSRDFFSEHIPAGAQHFQCFFFKFLLILIESPVHPVWHDLHMFMLLSSFSFLCMVSIR